jgi:hypothetical protein
MFADRHGRDYRLRHGSPAIGRAVAEFTPAAVRRRSRAR